MSGAISLWAEITGSMPLGARSNLVPQPLRVRARALWHYGQPMPLHVLETVRDANSAWNLPASYLEALRERFPGVRFTSAALGAETEALLPDADVVLGWGVNAKNFALARTLKWVHVTAAGVGSLLFPAMVESGVTITNSRGLHADAMAEHTLGVMLSFVRQLHLCRDAQREHRWSQDEMWELMPALGPLKGSTMVLVGLGAVGGAISARARALGVHVIGVRRRPDAGDTRADEQFGIDELPRLLSRADWLVLAAPLTAGTRHLIGAGELGLLKRTAVVINVGRGHLIDEPALVAALLEKRIAGAGLDVVEVEPLPEESALWDMPNVLLTPHTSGVAPDYWSRAMAIFADNLQRYIDGRALNNVVDKREGY